MPSVARRAGNKASSGVNKEGQRYRESNLYPSPDKQSASAKEDPPSLTLRHNRNQAQDTNAVVGSSGAAAPRKRAGRGRRSAKHGRKRRATNNERPGSAVSSSPVEDRVSNYLCIVCARTSISMLQLT